MSATQSLVINLNQPIRQSVVVVKGESDGRTLSVTLNAGGVALNLTGCAVTLYATLPSNEVVFDNFTVTSAAAGRASILLSSAFCAVSGDATCEIRITGSGGEVTKSHPFTLTILDAEDYTDAVEATSEYTALDTALGLVSGHEARIAAVEAVDGIIMGNGAGVYAAAVGADVMALVWPLVYPVGCIYQSVVSTSPATLFGGTWAALGAGRVLVGIDAAQTEFDTVEETGGEKTHTLTVSELPATTLTVGGTSTDGLTGTNKTYNVLLGSGEAHNNLQPYLVVYRWKRTA
jgi:hypothetical protein